MATNAEIQHNAEGNLLSVDSGATAVDVYDALNRRVRVQTASATDEYIYDYANRRISTWLPNGAGIEGRIYWDNRLTAFRAQNGDTYFDQKDVLGTDRLRMNYAAVAAANYTSLPFGDDYAAHVSGSYGDQDNNHFALLDRDAESDTDHAQFRQYYNMWGRWMSPDPYSGSYDITNLQRFNRYAYASNNPLAFTDSSGLYVAECDTATMTATVAGCSSKLWGDGIPNETGAFEDQLGMLSLMMTYVNWGGPNSPLTPTDGSGYAYQMGVTSNTMTLITVTGYGSYLLTYSTSTAGTNATLNNNAPSNPQQKQPQKNPCPPGTRAAGAVEAAEGTGDALAALNLAAVHYAAAVGVVGVTCFTPEPGEPLACAVGTSAGFSLFGGGTALAYFSYREVKDNVIPAIKQAITCVPSGG